uniref:translation initiation factor IF-2-like n=1 Tax=Callithrix jacchus TaxID=9483 RepID=UPI0023DD1731|nr:translation initiation factor IF-2-like [Callithrix jacchus]
MVPAPHSLCSRRPGTPSPTVPAQARPSPWLRPGLGPTARRPHSLRDPRGLRVRPLPGGGGGGGGGGLGSGAAHPTRPWSGGDRGRQAAREPGRRGCSHGDEGGAAAGGGETGGGGCAGSGARARDPAPACGRAESPPRRPASTRDLAGAWAAATPTSNAISDAPSSLRLHSPPP